MAKKLAAVFVFIFLMTISVYAQFEEETSKMTEAAGELAKYADDAVSGNSVFKDITEYIGDILFLEFKNIFKKLYRVGKRNRQLGFLFVYVQCSAFNFGDDERYNKYGKKRLRIARYFYIYGCSVPVRRYGVLGNACKRRKGSLYNSRSVKYTVFSYKQRIFPDSVYYIYIFRFLRNG